MNWPTLAFFAIALMSLISVDGPFSMGELDMLSFLALMGAMAVISLFFPQRRRMRGSWLDVAIFMAYLYVLANQWAVSHVPAAMTFLRWSLWLVVYLVVRLLCLAGKPDRIGSITILLMMGSFETILGLGQMLHLAAPSHSRYLMAGTFFNPGQYGAYLAIVISMLLAYQRILHREGRGEWLLWVVALIGAMVIGVMCRAGLVAIVVTVVVMWRRELWHRRWLFALVILTLMAVVAALYFLKRGSADGRWFMTIVSLEAWKAHFWLGSGLGSFLGSFTDAELAYFAAHPSSPYIPGVAVVEYPFNFFLKVAVELGATGLLLFLAAALLALIRLWRRWRTGFYGLLSLLIVSAFTYTLELVPFCLLLSFFAGVAGGNRVGEGQQRWVSTMLKSSFILLIAAIGGVVYWQYSSRIEAYGSWQRVARYHSPQLLPHYKRWAPWLGDNYHFLFDYGQMLREQTHYIDSNHYLLEGARLSNDPMFHVLMGNNYQSMGLYQLADSAFMRAFAINPNKLYPLYRQMKLYEATADTIRLIPAAQRVADFTPKVPSKAVTQMKQEARALINHLSSPPKQ